MRHRKEGSSFRPSSFRPGACRNDGERPPLFAVENPASIDAGMTARRRVAYMKYLRSFMSGYMAATHFP